jgi:hypothetical protein
VTFVLAAAAIFLVAVLLIISAKRRGSPYQAAFSSSSSAWSGRLRQSRGPRAKFYEGGWIRFAQPSGRGSEFLPGCLQVVGPEDAGLEIRFIKPDKEPAEITFGRKHCDSYSHVELKALTVSREHAVITVEGPDWTVRSLSSKNPVRVNGQALSDCGSSLILRAGDTIEMGPAQFQFRQG